MSPFSKIDRIAEKKPLKMMLTCMQDSLETFAWMYNLPQLYCLFPISLLNMLFVIRQLQAVDPQSISDVQSSNLFRVLPKPLCMCMQFFMSCPTADDLNNTSQRAV